MHLRTPIQIWFIFHAVFKIPKYMRKTFLMQFSIVIEGLIMIMNKNSVIYFSRTSLDSFMTFLLSGEIERIVIIGPNKYLHIFAMDTANSQIDMLNRTSLQVIERFCLFFLGFFRKLFTQDTEQSFV